MTVQDVMDEVRATRSPTAEAGRLIAWISAVEEEAAATVRLAAKPEETPTLPYTTADADRELLIDGAQADAYLWYCVYRLNLVENQIANADNALARYEELLDAWKKRRQREHTPRPGPRITLEGYNV